MQREKDKWKQRSGLENEVTDRARIQVNFCSVVHFPTCPFPVFISN